MITRPILALAAAILVSGLTACSRSAEEPAPVDTAANAESPARDERSDAFADEPVQSPETAPPVDANLADAEASAVEQAPDEQMLDDASASGMTARTSRGDAPANEGTAATQPDEN